MRRTATFIAVLQAPLGAFQDATDAELGVALDDRLENLADVIGLGFTYPPGLLCQEK